MERQTDGTIKIVGDKNLVTRNDRNYHDLDMMPSYFRNVVKDGVGATWQPNTAYIYTEVTNMPRIRKLGILPVNSTGYNYLGSAQSFKPINNRESRTVKSAWVIKFTYRGRTSPYIRGFYFPDDRVLYIGRLYANSCGYDYAEGIINTLKERFGIAELPPLPPVTSATPAQKECGPTCTVCVGSCKNYVNRKRVTVGTDPEFEITRNGAVISPDRNKYHGLNSEIGLDGAGSQLEVRPKAFVKATDTTNYIKKIMEKIGDSISTIGNRFPVGGHIHLGVGTSYTPSTDLLWLLDAFVGKPTIDLREQPDNTIERCRHTSANRGASNIEPLRQPRLLGLSSQGWQ
jgi:hypothetical protein